MEIALPYEQFLYGNAIVCVPKNVADALPGDEITITLRRMPKAGECYEAWHTLSEAAERHLTDVDGLTLESSRMRLRRAIDAGEIQTNGESGRKLRLAPDSLGEWRLRQRELDLRRRDD
jgi:hypothetical protein